MIGIQLVVWVFTAVVFLIVGWKLCKWWNKIRVGRRGTRQKDKYSDSC